MIGAGAGRTGSSIDSFLREAAAGVFACLEARNRIGGRIFESYRAGCTDRAPSSAPEFVHGRSPRDVALAATGSTRRSSMHLRNRFAVRNRQAFG